MPKGKVISKETRLLIHNSMMIEGFDAQRVWRCLFNNDNNVISLRTLENLEIMFQSPDRNQETCNYLYATTRRGVESQDHSVKD